MGSLKRYESNNKPSLYAIVYVLFAFFSFQTVQAQIGINTINPDPSSILDVSATEKGILIPRISLSAVSNTMLDGTNTAATGLLIYNTNAAVTGGDGVGFYLFNGTLWEKITTTADASGSTADADFYEANSTDEPSSINDDIYTLGKLGIGTNNPNYVLDIYNSNLGETVLSNLRANYTGNINRTISRHTLQYDGNGTARGVESVIFGTGDASKTGILSSITNDGSGQNVGTQNSISSSGSNTIYGVRNLISGSNAVFIAGTSNEIFNTSSSNKIGTRNTITSDGDNFHYGTYNSLNGNGDGIHYGVYNTISGTGDATQYGIFNQFLGQGSGIQIGISNNMVSSNNDSEGIINTITGSSSTRNRGIYNVVQNNGIGEAYGICNLITGTGNGSKFGTLAQIPNTTGGTHYGVYSSVTKPGSFSGFFVGTVAIGTKEYTAGASVADFYTMPASRGTNGQIMQTDASGNVSWVDPATITSEDADFFEEGTTNAPDAITDDIYTQGNLAIGKNTADYPLDINQASTAIGINTMVASANTENSIGVNVATPNEDQTRDRTGFNSEIYGTDNNDKIGYLSQIVGAGNGNKIGSLNYVETTGSTQGIIGVLNNLETHFSDNGSIRGVYNLIRGNGTGEKYGTYTSISSLAGGTHYGIFCSVRKANSYAGYFLGNVSIGTSSTDNYILPASRGTANQIMQTDGSGNVSWVDAPSTSFWSRTGTQLDVATAGDDINFSSDQTSITFPATTGTPSSMMYLFESGTTNANRMIFSQSPTYAQWGLEYRDATDTFVFKSSLADRVEIGLFGTYPLRAYGTIRAEDFESDTTTYPDYVFENYYTGTSELNKTYSFKTIKQVESYIKENGHLPGVASYEEIKKRGMTINLSKTSITNLEKIEELFIYTIELRNENELLKQKQAKLEKRLQVIEKLLQEK